MSNLKNYLFTSESVSEGHPDKVSDRISDMVVDTYLSKDPQSRVACETLTTTNKVVLAGEVRGPKTNKDELILLLYRDECKEWKVGLCDIEAQKKYGVEKGTLELLWTEITIKLSRNLTL